MQILPKIENFVRVSKFNAASKPRIFQIFNPAIVSFPVASQLYNRVNTQQSTVT
ncbi:hypothetical protein [Tychonema sp. LEGE 07203]|uniref:hypothetical protein n=1 Tax=Tychonema sp. LEGE 07203 TaxID=1828671 RepID=UPI0019FB02A1|nr:hypothetical protein [Tychonema sp. LEGE 07203]MBE9097574.1 hypothetical protein [Tychonema sp. LEGE 07203]